MMAAILKFSTRIRDRCLFPSPLNRQNMKTYEMTPKSCFYVVYKQCFGHLQYMENKWAAMLKTTSKW